MPLYLEFLFILCANFLPFLVLNTWSKKNYENSFESFSVFFEKQQKWQTYYLRFIYHKKHVSTVASGVDNSNSMDVVIAKKKKKEKRKEKAR